MAQNVTTLPDSASKAKNKLIFLIYCDKTEKDRWQRQEKDMDSWLGKIRISNSLKKEKRSVAKNQLKMLNFMLSIAFTGQNKKT